jgi:hypothetical protein
MDGMSYDRYLGLTHYERWLMHDCLTDLIETTEAANNDDDDEGSEGMVMPRPKRLRK